MRISDWSSDLCSSDLHKQHRIRAVRQAHRGADHRRAVGGVTQIASHLAACPGGAGFRPGGDGVHGRFVEGRQVLSRGDNIYCPVQQTGGMFSQRRSEEHTSELQSLMRISYAVYSLKNKEGVKHIPALHTQKTHVQLVREDMVKSP